MIDWSDAFDNSGYVDGSTTLPDRLAALAQTFRDAACAAGRAKFDLIYGEMPRNRLDLFKPEGEAKGLIVFVHGGYWLRFEKSYWSHLAAGSLAKGWAIAMPSYTLAPDAKIPQITKEIASAIEFAGGLVQGPIRLVGHSAGGHLVSRMACVDHDLPGPVAKRLEKIVSVSGVHDLRPLTQTNMNAQLGLDDRDAQAESPALISPRMDVECTFWVGAAERPEFLRQTRLIAETWSHAGAFVRDYYEPDCNHFTVIDALADADSALIGELTAAVNMPQWPNMKSGQTKLS